MFDFLFKGPFINNLRIREGVTHVRTNANKGGGGGLTLRTFARVLLKYIGSTKFLALHF